MITRKSLISPKKEKPEFDVRRGPKVRKGVSIDDLPDVIVDGKFSCKKGDTLIFRKDYFHEVRVSYVTVMSLDEDQQLVNLWDETHQQWTAAEVKDAARYTLKKAP